MNPAQGYAAQRYAAQRYAERAVPGPALAAVLFDLDGLLVDSEPVWTIAEKEIVSELGGRWDASVKAAILGRSIDVNSRELVRIAGSAVAPEVVQQRLLTRMAELFRIHLPWRPGAVALLDALHRARVPLALVSSSYRVLVDAALDTIGAHRFTTTVAGDEVRRPKPHPEPYLTAAARLGVHPAACVVFEDSPTGIAAGEAAGCVCVGVPDVVALQPAPDRPVFASLTEVSVDELRALPAVAATRRA